MQMHPHSPQNQKVEKNPPPLPTHLKKTTLPPTPSQALNSANLSFEGKARKFSSWMSLKLRPGCIKQVESGCSSPGSVFRTNLCYVSNSSASTRGLFLLLDKKGDDTKENIDIIIASEE